MRSSKGGTLPSRVTTAYAYQTKDRFLLGAALLLSILLIVTSYFIFLDFYDQKHKLLGYVEGEWKSGYPIANTCTLRTNKINPWLEDIPCPAKNANKGWLNFKGEGDNLETQVVMKPGKFSSKTCTSDRYCMYENVCVKGTDIFYYVPPGEPIRREDYGWAYYRDAIHNTTFSWHYGITFERSPPEKARYLEGTSLWFDQSWDYHCHPGHGGEFYNKVLELRSHFPQKINRILYAKDTEPSRGAPQSYKMCFIPCNFLRLAFEDENWEFPPLYWLEQPKDRYSSVRDSEWPWTNELLCLDKVLVPPNTHQHFTSLEAADNNRMNALKMCGIPPRHHHDRSPKNVFFWERAFDRQLVNKDELCAPLQSRGFHVYAESDDLPSFCQQVASIYSADIIVTVDGSSNYLLSYARPGSVVIIVYPFNFRVPDWKLLSYYSGLRVLELLIMNSTNSIGPTDSPLWTDGKNSLKTPLLECTHHIMCRIAIRSRNTYLPVEIFMDYFNYALEIYNRFPVATCEKPYPWPKKLSEYGAPHWSQYGFELNYDICEPPNPRCQCCKDDTCAKTVVELNKRAPVTCSPAECGI